MADLDNVRFLNETYRKVHEEAERLKSGDGGGTSGDMEDRVKRLEGDVSDIKKLVTDIRVLLASIDERTKHMPTRWEVAIIMFTIIAAIGAVVALTSRFMPS